VETGSDQILQGADKTDVAFLVVGDPFGYVGFSLARSISRS
jgi:diphthine methyl ester synthase